MSNFNDKFPELYDDGVEDIDYELEAEFRTGLKMGYEAALEWVIVELVCRGLNPDEIDNRIKLELEDINGNR